MSRPFYKTETEAIETTKKEIAEFLEENGYAPGSSPVQSYEAFGHIILIFMDKELSINPSCFLAATHTGFAWTYAEGLTGKGEGGFLCL